MQTANSNKPVEVSKEGHTPTPEDFKNEYQALCDRMQYRIVASPAWVATNHNSFEMVIQYQIGKLPQGQ